ncbi:LysR family transcriptional regulator [Nitratireductor aquimarinus]|nr:LysR family transcriptional regulator [Nitratireductor aquimarinus]
MELNLLEDFVCLAEVRNFSRAAEIRNVSQSTFSKRIRNLEHWLGTPLVDRSTYPVNLTAEGRVMVRKSRDLVQQINELRSGVRQLAIQARDRVEILAMHTLRMTFLPKWLEAIEEQIGSFDRRLNPASSSYRETIRQFRDGESDILLTYIHPSVELGFGTDELECIILGSDRLVPVSTPDESGRPLYDLDRDDAIRFLSYGSQSFFAQVLTPSMHEKSVSLDVVDSNPMSFALQSLAIVGTGLAWVPESLARDELEAGNLVIAGKSHWVIDLKIALYRKKRQHRAVVNKLWQAAYDQAHSSSSITH